jgi:hypothetical protein
VTMLHMMVTAALVLAAFTSAAEPFAAAPRPSEPGMTVVGDAKIHSGGEDVAHGTLNTPLGVDADIDFPASHQLKRPARLSVRVDRNSIGQFAATVTARIEGQVVAAITKDFGRAKMTVELEAEGLKWTLKMKVRPSGKEDGMPFATRTPANLRREGATSTEAQR